MNISRPGMVGTLLIASICLAACSGATDTPTLTSSKAITLRMENRIAALVPHRYVARHEQKTSAHLLSCVSGDFTWPGRTTLSLSENPDSAAVFRKVEGGLKGRDFSFSRYVTANGDARLQIVTPHEGQYLVGLHTRDHLLVITSRSPCFSLSGGNDADFH